MSKLDLSQIFLQLEHEISRLNSTKAAYRDATREDARRVISFLKSDIESWVYQLNERTIACYEMESIMNAKRDSINLELLKNHGLTNSEIEEVKDDILRLIAKAIMNSYLESLFRNQNRQEYTNSDISLN
jgi:hypothetical protein